MARDVAWIALAVAVILLLILLVSGLGMGIGMIGFWMHGPAGGSGFIGPWWRVLMIVVPLLLIAGVVALVVWLARAAGPAVGQSGSTRALDILRERYARGELTREQYDEMRDDVLR